MRAIKCSQNTPQYGIINIHMRFKDRLIFLKCNHSPTRNNMIKQLESKGAIITEGQGWLMINIFGTKEWVKLGDVEFDVSKTSPEAVELFLQQFFKKKYTEAKFIVQELEE